MRPEEMGSLPLQVEKLFYGLQDRIMSDVVRRIKKTGEITSTADYQLNRIKILGNSSEFIEDELKRLLNVTYPELFALYDKVIDWEYVRNKDIYEQVNGQFTPPEENNWLQELSSAIVSQTEGDIKNITRSLGFSLDYGDGKKVFTPLSEYYQKYLDRACLDIASGAFDYNTALRRVVREMTSSGIRSVDYASGYSNRAPVAARRAVMTGVHKSWKRTISRSQHIMVPSQHMQSGRAECTAAENWSLFVVSAAWLAFAVQTVIIRTCLLSGVYRPGPIQMRCWKTSARMMPGSGDTGVRNMMGIPADRDSVRWRQLCGRSGNVSST